MRRRFGIIILFTVSALLFSCGIEKPSSPDGSNTLTLYAVDTSGVDGAGWVPVPGATVKISSTTFSYAETFEADENGLVVIEGMPAATYTIMAEKIMEEENVLILGQLAKTMVYEPEAVDTVFMSYIQASPVVINELYYCGCSAGYFYFFDQFIELYNSSQDTVYLDGYIVCRSTQVEEVLGDIEAVDYAIAYYVYEFPGTRGVTKQVPLAPKEFMVLAGDAYEHSLVDDACVDLTGADWEFVNPIEFDIDNPAVPNLEPITPWSKDFTMNLAHQAIWLATGENHYFEAHWDGSKMQDYVHIPLGDIVDGVEYASNPDSDKYLTIRIDAGLGGNGNTKYSAQSIQRRYPGLDSNNSTFDFEIIGPPTPGYQH